MHAGDALLGFGHEVPPAILDEIGITDASSGVVVIEQDLRLGPVNVAVLLDAAADPCGVAVEVVIPIGGVDSFSAVVVIPEQELAVGELLDEVGRARVLDATSRSEERRVGNE